MFIKSAIEAGVKALEGTAEGTGAVGTRAEIAAALGMRAEAAAALGTRAEAATGGAAKLLRDAGSLERGSASVSGKVAPLLKEAEQLPKLSVGSIAKADGQRFGSDLQNRAATTVDTGATGTKLHNRELGSLAGNELRAGADSASHGTSDATSPATLSTRFGAPQRDFAARARDVDNPYLREYEAVQRDPQYKNAIDIVRGRKEAGTLEYRRAYQLQENTRHALTHKYSWAVPNEEALAAIAREGPIIEAGAGSGYWAHLLKNVGADVVAFDQHGVNVAENYYHSTARNAWTNIIRGTEDTVSQHPDRTLFMSFPPMSEPFGVNVLNNYRGRRFAFVGELGDGSCTGDRAFHNALETQWREVQSVELPNWTVASGTLWDRLHIFERLK